MDYRKRLRMSSFVIQEGSFDSQLRPESISADSPERKKRLWKIRVKHVDKRVGKERGGHRQSKFNIKRHQSFCCVVYVTCRNYRCNIKLTVRMNYVDDTARIETHRADVLAPSGNYVCVGQEIDRQTLICNPYFLDYVSLYAGNFTKNAGKYTQIEIPNLDSLHPSIRVGSSETNDPQGRVVSSRDIKKALNYLDTGYCGKVIKSYSIV